MSKIKITLPNNEVPVTGKLVSFIAPCACEGITGIIVNDIDLSFVDACGNPVNEIYNVFSQGALISVILDMTNHKAYIQNAANNKYAAYYEAPINNGIASIRFEYQKRYRIYASKIHETETDYFNCQLAICYDDVIIATIPSIEANDVYHDYFDFELLKFDALTKTLIYSVNNEVKMLTVGSTLLPNTLQISNTNKVLVINI